MKMNQKKSKLFLSAVSRLTFISLAALIMPQHNVYATTSEKLRITPETIQGEAWPLTIPEITVDCSAIPAVIGVYKEKSYTLNGVAMAKYGGRNILEVAKPVPEFEGLKMPSSAIVDYALEKCGWVNPH